MMVPQVLLGRESYQLGGACGYRGRIAPEFVQDQHVIHGVRTTSNVAQFICPAEGSVCVLKCLARPAKHPARQCAFAECADAGVVSAVECRMHVMTLGVVNL